MQSCIAASPQHCRISTLLQCCSRKVLHCRRAVVLIFFLCFGSVLLRLRQKDVEWQTARRELNLFWKDVYEKGAQKFWEGNVMLCKSADQRNCSFRALLTAVETQYNGRFIPMSFTLRDNPGVQREQAFGAISGMAAASAVSRSSSSSAFGPVSAAKALGSARDTVCTICTSIHRDIHQLITTVQESQRVPAEMRRLYHNFWATFVLPFFGLPSQAPQMPCPWITPAGHFGPVKVRLCASNGSVRRFAPYCDRVCRV